MLKILLLWNSLAKWRQTWKEASMLGVQTWHRLSLGCVPFKIVSNSPTLHSRWLLFFKVMIISLWNLLQYHYIVRWAIQAQCAEPLVKYCNNII
jgi:hypothetical protein